MTDTRPEKIKRFFQSFQDVFAFFYSAGRRSKRTQLFFFLSFIPVIIALVIKIYQLLNTDQTMVPGSYLFNNLIMALYLQFLIIILALFYGTSICSEELENKTLPYLLTRPVSKTAVILGKYAAFVTLEIIMIGLGVFFSFLIMNIDRLTRWPIYVTLGRDLGVLFLGIICYSALFTFIGTFIKRSILVGLIFGFGWESVIQYFPGSTQKFAVVHYLKSLLPEASSERFSFLLIRLEPTSPIKAIITLVLITGFFLTLACLIFTFKEYILED
jgi:ABC-type transport system involved in multi-copper enzyme maturation permease subunit